MRKHILLLLIVLFSAGALQAQRNLYPPRQGKTSITGDTAVNGLVRKHIDFNEKVRTIPGYRIQIASLSGVNAKNNAFALKDKFKSEYAGVEVYVIFDEPNFKIKVGDFRTRLEAYCFLTHIKEFYPGTVVHDDIYPIQLDWSEMIPESEDDI